MMTVAKIRLCNQCVALIGMMAFAFLLTYVNLAPQAFAKRISEFAIERTSAEVIAGIAHENGENRPNSRSAANGQIIGLWQRDIARLRQELDGGIDQFVADVLAARCKLDCERREDAARSVRAYYETSIARNRRAIVVLEQLALQKFDEVARDLRNDVNIFAISNLVLLAASFFLSSLNKKAAAHIVPISIILTSSTALMAAWYVFGQSWIMTIIFNDYVGWIYPAVLSVVAILLTDIAINSGRLTNLVFNRTLDAVGSSFQFAPC